jgi:HEAT repeat protein
MWDPLVHLLADESEDARCAAARALAATGHDHAKLLLRFKILTGDKEPAVMAECFSAIVALTRSIDLVSPFLDSEDDALREAAVMALGESRLSAAFETLSQMNASAFGDDFRRLLFLATAMTRQPQAIDFLLAQFKQSKQHHQHAIEALALYRSDSAVRSRVESAVRDAGEKLLPIFHKHFGG